MRRRSSRRRRSVGGERSRPTSSSAPTARTASRRRRSGSAQRDRPRRRVRGQRPVRRRLARALRAPRGDRARRHPGRLRLGVPEGRPRERRRRRVADGGPAASASTCARVCAAHGLDPAALEEPARPPAAAAQARRRGSRASASLLVGDAAGLIDPVSGDGMYECFVSSRLAATADPRPARRPRDAARAVRGRGRSRARAAAPRLVEAEAAPSTAGRAPRGSWRGARLVWRSIERLLLAELTAPGEQRGLARLPLRALEVLGRT